VHPALLAPLRRSLFVCRMMKGSDCANSDVRRCAPYCADCIAPLAPLCGLPEGQYTTSPHSYPQLGAAIISGQRITAFMAAEEQQDYVTRLTQPQGTTPPPPPNSRRRSFSVYDRARGSGESMSTVRPYPSQRRHSECGLLLGKDVAASAAAGRTAKAGESTNDGGPDATSGWVDGTAADTAVKDADTAFAAPGAGSTFWSRPPSMVTPRDTRALRVLASTSLQGVEPGLTIRAGGFRWAAEAMRQHEEQKRQEEKDAAAAGAGGGKGSKGWRRWSFRRQESPPRPFMEVSACRGPGGYEVPPCRAVPRLLASPQRTGRCRL
jgi:hypothetical protein